MNHSAIFPMDPEACTFTSRSQRVNVACVGQHCTRQWALHAHNLTWPHHLLSVCLLSISAGPQWQISQIHIHVPDMFIANRVILLLRAHYHQIISCVSELTAHSPIVRLLRSPFMVSSRKTLRRKSVLGALYPAHISQRL